MNDGAKSIQAPGHRLRQELREQVVDLLTMNYAHGKIGNYDLEERLEQAMYCEDGEALLQLVSDLDLDIDQKFLDHKRQLEDDMNGEPAERVEEDMSFYFSSANRAGNWLVPPRISITDCFSQVTLDFTEAQFESRQVDIDLFSLMSNLTIHVPENVQVVSNVSGILSSVKNKVTPGNDMPGPRITLRGNVIMSDLRIKVQRPLKQRLVAFADGLKSLIN